MEEAYQENQEIKGKINLNALEYRNKLVSPNHCFRRKRKVEKRGKGKGKAIPLEAWTGPEGSSRMRLPDFKTIGT